MKLHILKMVGALFGRIPAVAWFSSLWLVEDEILRRMRFAVSRGWGMLRAYYSQVYKKTGQLRSPL